MVFLRALTLCGALSAVLLATSSARASEDDEARVRYERAVRLYEEGVYDAALVELSRAREKSDGVSRLGRATDVLVGAAAVAAGVSLWLTLRGPSGRDSKTAQLGFTLDGVRYRTEF